MVSSVPEIPNRTISAFGNQRCTASMASNSRLELVACKRDQQDRAWRLQNSTEPPSFPHGWSAALDGNRLQRTGVFSANEHARPIERRGVRASVMTALRASCLEIRRGRSLLFLPRQRFGRCNHRYAGDLRMPCFASYPALRALVLAALRAAVERAEAPFV